MKSYGPLYAGTLQYWHTKALPILEVGSTQETEHPYKKGKCLVLRFPFTHTGYYFGVWYHKPNIHIDDEQGAHEILQKALKGREAWKAEDGLYDEFFQE